MDDPYVDSVARIVEENIQLNTENYKLKQQLRRTETNIIVGLLIIVGVAGLLSSSLSCATSFKVAHDGDVNGYFISGRALFDNNLTILGNGPGLGVMFSADQREYMNEVIRILQ